MRNIGGWDIRVDLDGMIAGGFAGGGVVDGDGPIGRRVKSMFSPKYGGTFDEAYSKAKGNGDEYFRWNGGRYEVKDSGGSRKPDAGMPDYSGMDFGNAYKKASGELPLGGEFGWNGNVYKANSAVEDTDDFDRMPVYKLWETVTGQPWSKAKEWGLSDGRSRTNIGIRRALLKYQNGNKAYTNFTSGPETVKTLAIASQNIKAKDLDAFDVPDSDEPITIKGNGVGVNFGTKTFNSVLDSLAKHGFENGFNAVETFGLPAQESAMTPLRGMQTHNKDDYNYEMYDYGPVAMMMSAWDINNTPLVNLSKAIFSSNDPEWTLKRGGAYDFGKYADYEEPNNVLDWSYKYYKTGGYNTGEKDHRQKVINRGRALLNSQQMDKWFYEHWLPDKDNKDEWIRWWKSR